MSHDRLHKHAAAHTGGNPTPTLPKPKQWFNRKTNFAFNANRCVERRLEGHGFSEEAHAE
jgi:hypothetical protein